MLLPVLRNNSNKTVCPFYAAGIQNHCIIHKPNLTYFFYSETLHGLIIATLLFTQYVFRITLNLHYSQTKTDLPSFT